MRPVEPTTVAKVAGVRSDGVLGYRVRWWPAHDAKPHSRQFTDRDAAEAFRLQLLEMLGEPPQGAAAGAVAHQPRAKKQKSAQPRGSRRSAQPPAVVDALCYDQLDLGDYDGTAAWWDALIGQLAMRLVELATSGDRGGLDLWSKAARAVKELAAAQTAHRDVKRLEQLLRALQSKYKELTASAASGATLQ